MAIKKEKIEEVLIEAQEESNEYTLPKEKRRRNIFIFTLNSFFIGSANAIYYILYTPYFRAINDSERLFGIIGTIASLIFIIGLIVSDYLNDIIGFKRVLIIAQILVAVSFLFFIFNPKNIVWIIIAVLVLNFSFSLSESPNNILITETAGDKQKGRVSSLVAFFGRGGDIIVSTIITIIATIFAFNNQIRSYFFIYAMGISSVVTLLTILFIINPIKIEQKKSDEIKEKEKLDVYSKNDKKNQLRGFIGGFIGTFKDKWVLKVALIFFFDAFVWSIGLGVHWAGLTDPELFGIYAITDQKISLYSLITGITVLIAMFPSGWLVDRIGAKTLLFISELCGLLWAVLVILYTFFPYLNSLMFIARVSIGLSIALWIPSTIALFTNVQTKRKSKVYNSIAIFRTIGWLPGGLISGLFYEGIPQPFGFLVPIMITILGVLIIVPLFIKLPNRPPENNQNNTIMQKE